MLPKRFFLLAMIVVFWLAACAPLTLPPAPTEPLVPAVMDDECPPATADTQSYANSPMGYCLLLPTGYDIIEVSDTSVAVVVGSLLNVTDPRLHVDVTDLMGGTAAEAADAAVADALIALPDWDAQQTTVTVGGEEAVVVDKLPGQEWHRDLFVAHSGRLYRLSFMPADEALGDAYARMEVLYQTVIDSFTFIAPTAPMGIPLPPADAPAEEMALRWEHTTQGDAAECQRMGIAADGRAWVGRCADTELTATGAPFQWEEILARFAPLQVDGDNLKLTFAGEGDLSGPAWERALQAWTEVSYNELRSGRVSASGRTVFSWWLGEVEAQPGVCRHLVVLSHGYAYANLDPCAGGQNVESTGGWIDSAAWEEFDTVLYGFAPYSAENNYLDGRGEATLGAAEAEQLTAWAEQVFEEIGQ